MTFTKTEIYVIYACELPKNTQLNGKFLITDYSKDKILTNPTYEELYEYANEVVKKDGKCIHVYFEGVQLKKKREDGIMEISLTLSQ
jgi:hypothetical protein